MAEDKVAELIIGTPKILNNCSCPRCRDHYKQRVEVSSVKCNKCGLVYIPDIKPHIPALYAHTIQSLLSQNDILKIYAEAEKYKSELFEIYWLWKSYGNWEVGKPRIVDKQNTKVKCTKCGNCNECVVCGKCAAAYPAKTSKCPRCGSQKKKQNYIVFKTVNRCLKCKHDNEMGLLKCSECGSARLKVLQSCPDCGTQNVDYTVFTGKDECPLCRNKELSMGWKYKDYELVISRYPAYKIDNIKVDDGTD